MPTVSLTRSRPPSVLARTLLLWLGAFVALALSACATLPGRDALRVNVVGVEPLQGEGFELRFAVKLRAQNPNDTAVEYDGVALELELNGKALASGVSDQRGTVPRYGEAVFSVPVSISAFAAVRQAVGFVDGQHIDKIPYVLRGKLAGGMFGGVRFSDEGTLSLPQGTKSGG